MTYGTKGTFGTKLLKGEGEEIYREGFHPSLTYTGALNSLPVLREGGTGG